MEFFIYYNDALPSYPAPEQFHDNLVEATK